jgi:ADP-heptose:LPS heptosyltransferase
MALPALGGLLAIGEDAAIIAKRVYSDCVKSEAVKFVSSAPKRAVPDYRGVHRTHAWIRHFGVDPVRVPFAQGKGDVIVLSPWADRYEKRWPIMHWIFLAYELLKACRKVRVIGPQRALSTLEPIGQEEGIDNRIGQCSPSTWPDYFLDAACVVSPDTGAVHMADAMGVPVVGLYGITKMATFAPFWNPSHCIQADEVSDITPSQVLASIERAL